MKTITHKSVIELLNRGPLKLDVSPSVHPLYKIETVWAHIECFMNLVNNTNLFNSQGITEQQEQIMKNLYNNLSKFEGVDILDERFNKLLLDAYWGILDFYECYGHIDENQEISNLEISKIVVYIKKLHNQLLNYFANRKSLWISYEEK